MLLEMLEYRRPEGSTTQKEFCDRFLLPIMGHPDEFGNYIKEVGDEPTTAFMAHHDTVHKEEGIQRVLVNDFGLVYTEDSNCLGADCTTGVWLVLEMLKANIPGVYVVHAGEEIGCVGSRGLVKSNPKWLSRISAAISFDRFGTESVITHQMGYRTASDEFAWSLANALPDISRLEPDSGGSYTDSNEYSEIVPECTNLSVGYYDQHKPKETQDLRFAYSLRRALLDADWSTLTIKRDPSVIEMEDYRDYWPNWVARKGDFAPMTEKEELAELIGEHPTEIAEYLMQCGFSLLDIQSELGIVPDYFGEDDWRSQLDY